MKIKKLVGMLMCGVLLANTIPANAFTNSCSGQWGEDVGVNYNYNSDGTLVIKGETGTESLTAKAGTSAFGTGELSTKWKDDVKSIMIENINCLNPSIVNSNAIFSGNTYGNLEYVFINAETTGAFADSIGNIKTIVFGDKVRTINQNFAFLKDSANLTIYIPSTVTYIDEEAFPGLGKYCNVNVVCEYGSVAYNWAKHIDSAYIHVNVNIELYETQSTSQVVIDNRALYEIIVPENTTFKYTSDGWVADTFCGVVGTLPEGLDLTIKTDEEFRVIGDEIIAVENVSTTTEDSLSSTANGIITTTLDKATLDSKPHEIQINDTTTEPGYKIDYKCKTQSPHLMKQSYSGVIKFLIN